MNRRASEAVLFALIYASVFCQVGCAPDAKPTPPIASGESTATPETSPQIRALVESKCMALIRPQLAEPDKVRALDVSHRIDPNHRHVATYCMEAGDADGGFINVEALCFYDMSGRITGPPVVNDDPSIVKTICNR